MEGDKTAVAEDLTKRVVGVLSFGYSDSTKMLAESNIFWWSGMRKDMEDKCSNSTACMSSSKNVNNHLPSTKKVLLTVLIELGHQIEIDFSGKLHNKYVAGEPYMIVGSDQYRKWPPFEDVNQPR